MVDMGAKPHTPFTGAGIVRKDSMRGGRKLLGGERQRAMVNMGRQAPIPPLLGHENGTVRGESACGGRSICEPSLPKKLISGGEDGSSRFRRSTIRVRPSQK